jgi:hypothetical protein
MIAGVIRLWRVVLSRGVCAQSAACDAGPVGNPHDELSRRSAFKILKVRHKALSDEQRIGVELAKQVDAKIAFGKVPRLTLRNACARAVLVGLLAAWRTQPASGATGLREMP